MKHTTILLIAMLGQTAHAGMPASKEVECPIGGEKFEVTTTLSCSSRGRYMSMRPQSSCDFVTRIPICPSNGLPMYRSFSANEIGQLTDFIKTPEFDAMRDKPPHQVAYGVAHHLGMGLTPEGFSLALGAWWYERDAFLANPRMQDSFLKEAEVELSRVDEGSVPYLAGLVAFAMGHAGRDDYAQRWLREAEKGVIGDDPSAGTYVGAVRRCLSKIDADGCHPSDEFDPDR